MVHRGKFIKTEGKKEIHEVPENLEMYFSRSTIKFKVNLAAIITNKRESQDVDRDMSCPRKLFLDERKSLL